MPRAARWQSLLSVAFTFLLVSLSYEFKAQLPRLSGPLSWLVWLLSFLLANAGAALLWRIAVHVRFLRKIILAHTWIEGIWFFETTEYREDKNEIVQRGIAQFYYELPHLVLKVYVANLFIPTNETSNVTPISLALDDELRYMHYFVRRMKNVEALGAAVGQFDHDIGKKTEHYSGTITYLEEGEKYKRKQIGWKIDHQARTLAKQFGIEWKEQVLHNQDLWDELMGRKPKALNLKSKNG